MTDLLAPTSDHQVLEIGTGSGYQAAVLSQLVAHVYSLEIIPELAANAERLFDELNYNNISVKHANGHQGWVQHAPYDGVIVTAAAKRIPEPLVEQLKPRGRLVIPIGYPFAPQALYLVTKKEDGDVIVEKKLDVAFVPMTGDEDSPAV